MINVQHKQQLCNFDQINTHVNRVCASHLDTHLVHCHIEGLQLESTAANTILLHFTKHRGYTIQKKPHTLAQ